MTIRRRVKANEATSIQNPETSTQKPDTTVSKPEDSSRPNSNVDSRPKKKTSSKKKSPSKKRTFKMRWWTQEPSDEIGDLVCALIMCLIASFFAFNVPARVRSYWSNQEEPQSATANPGNLEKPHSATANPGRMTLTIEQPGVYALSKMIEQPGTYIWDQGKLTRLVWETRTSTMFVCSPRSHQATSAP
ncbi:hypothetical protein KCU65_g8916, partial [Aureobasidium melanogenum]